MPRDLKEAAQPLLRFQNTRAAGSGADAPDLRDALRAHLVNDGLVNRSEPGVSQVEPNETLTVIDEPLVDRPQGGPAKIRKR